MWVYFICTTSTERQILYSGLLIHYLSEIVLDVAFHVESQFEGVNSTSVGPKIKIKIVHS